MPDISKAKSRVHIIPDDVRILRTSERSTWKRCPQKWHWAYRDGFTVPHDETPNALWFGIGIHEALAHLYGPGAARRKDFIDRWDAYADDSARHIATTSDGTWDDKSWVDAKVLGHGMLVGYGKHWHGDPDWDVIYTEEPFEIEIPRLSAPEETEIVFVSTFDGVYRDKNSKKIYLMEHKTAAGISDAHLGLDDQGGAYWAVASNVLKDKGVLTGKERIAGITYNFLRKSLPDDRPKNADGYATNKPAKEHYLAALGGIGLTGKESLATLQQMATENKIVVFGEVSKSQEKPLFERFNVLRGPKERVTQIRRISEEAATMNAMRDGLIPVWKTPTRDCSWQCPFLNMCDLHERGEDISAFAKMAYTRRDPYADRRKSAGE